jgi:alanine dehydrogenase
MLYSVDTGEPLILFQDCSINELRTGAAGGIGAKYLAREDAGRVAVLGSSIHAETQLKAVCAVRSITHAKVFSPTPAHRLSFAEKVRRELNIEVRPVESPDEAMEEADILITATNSQKPVVDKSSLRGGMHITSIANGDKTRTRQEIDEAVIGHCAPLFITSKETVCVNESDIFRAVRNRVISWEQVYEIADLLLGKRPGRQSEKQITLYKLQGLGIMDVAIGFEAYKRLRGTSLVQTL